MSFARKSGDEYGKKVMDNAIKTVMDAAKIASARVVQKTPGATGDLIGKKTADKIISLGNQGVMEKRMEKKNKKSTCHQKKNSKLLMAWDCFKHHIKMEYQKIPNLLGTTTDEIPRFITKK